MCVLGAGWGAREGRVSGLYKGDEGRGMCVCVGGGGGGRGEAECLVCTRAMRAEEFVCVFGGGGGRGERGRTTNNVLLCVQALLFCNT